MAKHNKNGSVKTEENEGCSSHKTHNTDAEKKTHELLQDYIHARARRGQTTDSHSLAERVRREKISERMKMLQNIVPGCKQERKSTEMADIAMLVVEEYERRVRKSKAVANQEQQLVLGEEVAAAYASQVAVMIKKKIVRERSLVEVFKWVLEPRSQLGLAASHGFFSA